MVVELPAGLHLGGAFLGLVKPATIGAVEVDVALPTFRRGRSGHGFEVVLRSDTWAAAWMSFFRRRDPEGIDLPLGSPMGWNADGVLEFFVDRLLALPRGPVSLKEAQSFNRAVDGWVLLLEAWVEVVARSDLHQERIHINDEGRYGFIWLDLPGAHPGRSSRLPGEDVEETITVNMGEPLDLSPERWGAILAKASASEQPPEAHLFLRDARRAYNDGQHRRSVLDSATAAEIALSNLRDEAVEGAPPGVASYVIDNVTHIERIATFLRKAGVSVPENITEWIGRPRNKAVHEGNLLDADTAAKALAKAEEVVDRAFPWDDLL